jgi:hypothetical protein
MQASVVDICSLTCGYHFSLSLSHSLVPPGSDFFFPPSSGWHPR